MEKFFITGGQPLQGEIAVNGAKNAVLPLIAATLLTDEECVLTNVPGLADVTTMIEIVNRLGARTVDLTSRPNREAANRLYHRLGFVERATNVYRYGG